MRPKKREKPFVQESLLQERINGRIRCNVCERRCLLREGAIGWCRTRENWNGTLVTTTYGAVSSLAANPIEKKPFYHFHPGTYALTAGSWSCNFGCPWCQNWDISKVPWRDTTKYVSAQEFVELTKASGCQGTSISFNEPTLSLEWSLDVFRIAREHGLYNTYVTNGYMTPEALSLLIEAGLDAMNVDIKADAPAVKKFCKGVDVEKVWSICRLARSRGVHLEITTLVIPTVNESDNVMRSIARRIVTVLGNDVPWHITAYYPAYQFNAPPTSQQMLERAWDVGKSAGLQFVYVGNVPGHAYDNTYCPGCGELLIRRFGYDIVSNLLSSGSCPRCKRLIAGIWR